MRRTPPPGPRRVVVVAATPRSGSSLLASALRATGRFGDVWEHLDDDSILRDRARYRPLRLRPSARLEQIGRAARRDPGWRRPDMRGLTDGSVRRVLDRVAVSRTDATGNLGLKIMWHHFEPLFVDRGLDAGYWGAPVTWVRIRREDRLRQALSLTRAKATGQWLAHEGRRGEPVYDRAAIDAEVRAIAWSEGGWDRYFAGVGAEPTTVVYEELDADYEGTLRALFAVLGAPDIEVPPRALERQADQLTEAWLDRYRAETGAGVAPPAAPPPGRA